MLEPWFAITTPLSVSEQESLAEALTKNTSDTQQKAFAALASDTLCQQFATLRIGSSFAAQWLCKHPQQFLNLLESLPDFEPPLPELAPNLTLVEFDRALREVRNFAMAGIIWCDLNHINDLERTTRQLTALAEWAIQSALDYHYHHLSVQYGAPLDDTGRTQPLLVLGLGKLGAWELNLSSDVDLMFAYPDKGETQGGPKSVSNQEFFTLLGQRIIKSLDALTADGFVFRVDMRLRPYGNSGALASSYGALEDYYQTQGREWERFAMIKARIVASNAGLADQQELMQLLRSFTYRRYVDFSAIEALRNLKQLINREVARRRLNNNIKLGRGGIREVEFIAQAFQIIRGGRDKQLQERRVLKVLPMLEQLHCLPEGVAAALIEAYVFLRNLEHALQAQRDEQTQTLPSDAIVQQRLANVMGFEDYQALLTRLEQVRDVVSEQFQEVVAEPDKKSKADDAKPLKPWLNLWGDIVAESASSVEQLQQLGFVEPDKIQAQLQEFLTSPRVVAMDRAGRTRLDAFMPRLLWALVGQEQQFATLARVMDLLNAVVRRSAYLVLLTENPGALNQLLTLVAASPWIAKELAAHPALLDELLDPTTLYHIPTREDLHHELRQYLLRVPADDLEGQMEGLRYFRSAHALRVAACEITERLPLMKVSDYLTELAEVILAYVLQMAWADMVNQYGYPDGEISEVPNFIIVGYGKLGGIELGHGSDLDLVFIHDAEPQGQTSGNAEGKRQVDNPTFFMRLGQKVIHILNTPTLGGQLYEVDMRLRPSGNSGLLVARFQAFEKYQQQDAWTWEHQALVRARAIAGEPNLCKRFSELRREVLMRERDLDKLKHDVVDMRKKMRVQLGSNAKAKAEGQFALKQDEGGIVDIEFMVQYAVLAWSHTIPALADYTDNIRILGCLEESGQLQSQQVNQLVEAYKTYRSLGHRLVLQQQKAVVDGGTVTRERNLVQAVWQQLLGEA